MQYRILYRRIFGFIVRASQIIKLGITNTKYLPLRRSNRGLHAMSSNNAETKNDKITYIFPAFKFFDGFDFIVGFHVTDECGVFFGGALGSQDS